MSIDPELDSGTPGHDAVADALVFDVGAADFRAKVVERSHEVPVLVDFWAPWCGPCRTLGPLLERVVRDLGGKVLLAKVNSDDNPELASTFRVQGIPQVTLISGGKAVDRFVGVRREHEIRDFLRDHLPSPADALLASAAQHLEAGDPAAARQAFEQALEADCDSQAARLGLARTALAQLDLQGVHAAVEGIPASARERQVADQLLELATLVEKSDCVEPAAAAEALRQAVAGLAAGRHRDALEALAALAESDRSWFEQAPRRAMVAAFHLLGIRAPLSDEYRERLRRIYY